MDVATTYFPIIVVAQAWYNSAFLATTAIGICFHLLLARPAFEFEQFMRHFICSAGVLSVLYLSASVFLIDQTLTTALLRLVSSWTGFTVGVYLSLTVYRLSFHRCRIFPGPLAAKLTRFYTAYLNGQEAQFYEKLRDMHAAYGDFLRMGPREISILDPAAVPIIYGSKSQCRKTPFYNINGGHDDVVSINGIRDPARYKMRRQAWNRGLSAKAINLYQPRVKAQTDKLIAQIYSRINSPVDATLWAAMFSFDVMGDAGFGMDLGSLSSGQEHPASKQIHGFVWVLGVVQSIPWLPNLLSSLPGVNRGFAAFFDLCALVLADKEKSFDIDEEPRDLVSWLLKATYGKDQSASPTKESLADDSRGVIIAGSDTTSNTLANILYYLAKNPRVQYKLRSQLDHHISKDYALWDYQKVQALPFLDGIIDETLRLKPPVIQGVPRETPPEGIRVGNRHIPGHVVVSVPTILIQRDPRWWQQPDEFVPERWNERKEQMATGNSPWLPFQRGMHTCAGKSLAYMTLRTATSALVQNFDIRFAHGETGEKFDREFLASFMMALRPLQLIFTPRSDV